MCVLQKFQSGATLLTDVDLKYAAAQGGRIKILAVPSGNRTQILGYKCAV